VRIFVPFLKNEFDFRLMIFYQFFEKLSLFLLKAYQEYIPCFLALFAMNKEFIPKHFFEDKVYK
jgi:hypothetical protein